MLQPKWMELDFVNRKKNVSMFTLIENEPTTFWIHSLTFSICFIISWLRNTKCIFVSMSLGYDIVQCVILRFSYLLPALVPSQLYGVESKCIFFDVHLSEFENETSACIFYSHFHLRKMLVWVNYSIVVYWTWRYSIVLRLLYRRLHAHHTHTPSTSNCWMFFKWRLA